MNLQTCRYPRRGLSLRGVWQKEKAVHLYSRSYKLQKTPGAEVQGMAVAYKEMKLMLY